MWYNNAYGQIFTIINDEVILQHEFERIPLSFVENINVIDDKIYINATTEIIVFDSKTLSKTAYTYDYGVHPATDIIKVDQETIVFKKNQLLSLKDGGILMETANLSHLKLQKSRGCLINESDRVFMMLPDVSNNVFYDLNKLENVESSFTELKNTTINYYKKIKNTHWFLTSNGAFQYHYRDGKFILEENYLKNYTLTDVIIDYYDNIIFSTLNSGLFVIPDSSLRVLSFDATFSMRSINSLTLGAPGEVYFITDKKTLHKFNKNTNRGISVTIPRHQNQLLYYDSHLSRLMLFNKSEGSVWDSELKKGAVFNGVESPKNFIRLDHNRYLAAFYNRLEILDNNLLPLASLPIRSTHVTYTNSNNILFSSIDGLQFSNGKLTENTFIDDNGKKVFSSKLINTREKDVVWAQTNDSIYKIINNKITDRLTMGNLDITNSIQDIAIQDNILFAATGDGLFKYDPISKMSYKYSNSIINNTKKITALRIENEHVWFTDGVKLYMVNSNFENLPASNPVDLYIKDIKINAKKVTGTNFSASTNSTLQVDLWVNRFNSLDRYRYYYRLDNGEWQVLPQKTNSIVLNGLDPGKRTLSIQAEDIYTNQESIIKELKIDVESPYYIQWWFYTLLLLSVSALIILFFLVLNVYKKRKWQRKINLVHNEKKMAQLQLENLRSQMNPHFLFNALNSLQDHIIGDEKKEASKFLVKFSRLVRMYLDHSQYSKITLKQELDALSLYLFLENKRFNGQLNSSIVIDPAINQLTTLVPSLFIQPYIENSLLHGLLHKKGSKVIQINFSCSDGRLVCKITDNGIGRKEAAAINSNKSYKSFATRANSSRVELINAQESTDMSVVIEDLKNSEEKTLGTQVIISLKHEIKSINN